MSLSYCAFTRARLIGIGSHLLTPPFFLFRYPALDAVPDSVLTRTGSYSDLIGVPETNNAGGGVGQNFASTRTVGDGASAVSGGGGLLPFRGPSGTGTVGDAFTSHSVTEDGGTVATGARAEILRLVSRLQAANLPIPPSLAASLEGTALAIPASQRGGLPGIKISVGDTDGPIRLVLLHPGASAALARQRPPEPAPTGLPYVTDGTFAPAPPPPTVRPTWNTASLSGAVRVALRELCAPTKPDGGGPAVAGFGGTHAGVFTFVEGVVA